MALKGTLVFRFGPKFGISDWPKLKLNNTPYFCYWMTRQEVETQTYLKMTSQMCGRAESWNIAPEWKQFFIKCCLPSNVFFHQRFSLIKGSLSQKFLLHQRVSFIKQCLPSKINFHHWFSSIVVSNADGFADLVCKKGQMQATKCSIVTPKCRTAECGAVCVQAVGSSLFLGHPFFIH